MKAYLMSLIIRQWVRKRYDNGGGSYFASNEVLSYIKILIKQIKKISLLIYFLKKFLKENKIKWSVLVTKSYHDISVW